MTLLRGAFALCIGLAILWTAGPAAAEKLDISSVMAPVDSIKLDFEDGSKHFVLFVQREGKAEGQGLFAGANVTEYGMHDLIKGVGQAKHQLLDYGVWEVAGGTGSLAKLQGIGTMTIKPASKTKRRFTLTGDLVMAE